MAASSARRSVYFLNLFSNNTAIAAAPNNAQVEGSGRGVDIEPASVTGEIIARVVNATSFLMVLSNVGLTLNKYSFIF